MAKLRLLFTPRFPLDFKDCKPSFGECYIDVDKTAPADTGVREHSFEFNYEFS